MKKVYIAGKIDGVEDYEEKFNAAETELKEKGYICMNPAKAQLNLGFTHDEYMHICYAMIDACGSVYMLKNWKESRGAVMEHEYAKENNKVILYEKFWR